MLAFACGISEGRDRIFLRRLKYVLRNAVRETVNDPMYVGEGFKSLPVYLHFPKAEADYPGIWVGFEIASDLQRAGVAMELVDEDAEGNAGRYTLWRFQGWATFTGVALNNQERDRLFDEMIRIFAFGDQDPSTEHFRQVIENNEHLAIDIDFDEIGMRGMNDTPGTPWGSDQTVSEFTIAMECIGEFVADPIKRDLIKLTDIQIQREIVSPKDVRGPDFQDRSNEPGGWV